MAGPFLKVPPFPGSRALPLAVRGHSQIDDATASELARCLRNSRVGGVYWGSRPLLPDDGQIVLAPCSGDQASAMVRAATAEGLLDRCVMLASGGFVFPKTGVRLLNDLVDHWHLAEAAGTIWAGADHELALVAALAQRPPLIFGEGRFQGIANDLDLVRAVKDVLSDWSYHCPFSGNRITPQRAIELLSDWRALIDRNRRIFSVFGVAGWKRSTVGPMLWDGVNSPQYATAVPEALSGSCCVAAWKARTPAATMARLTADWPVAEIEDGLIRGRGLGANCVPPLSVVVDFSGIYFDPSGPSDLERILQSTDMDAELLDRAARLRQAIIGAGISKYGGTVSARIARRRERRILVVGQVEDDRSILSGGAGQTNLELLTRARAVEPNTWLIYRPHPDVEAGHRKGHVPDRVVLAIADEIERGGSITTLIETVDEVHCITSLAGFEALIRGKRVTTHGVPFYAGWGLTVDLGPIPSRRNRHRSIDELVAAAIILYPIYFDPVRRIPCPPEILIERIACGDEGVAAPLSGIRQFQGKLKVAIRSLREAAA